MRKFTIIALDVFLLSAFLFLTGCATPNQNKFLPSKHDESVSYFDSYDNALSFFEQISHGETTVDTLSDMGFDIKKENVELLNYVQVQDMFMSNANITTDKLPEGVIECLKAQDGCTAYRLTIEKENEERYGSFFADLFQFRKKTNHTGWKFEALFVVVDDTITYSLHSGEPNINRNEVIKNPLGPLNKSGVGGELIDRIL
jgi:hypothetical protein